MHSITIGSGSRSSSIHYAAGEIRTAPGERVRALRSAKVRNLLHGQLDIVPAIDPKCELRRTYLTEEQFRRLTEHMVQPSPPNASDATCAKFERLRGERVLYCTLIAFASPRRGELEAMSWADVDMERGVIPIPKGKTVRRSSRSAAATAGASRR